MPLTDVHAKSLSRALDEATLFAIEVDVSRRIVGLTMYVLLTPGADESGEEDTRVLLVLEGVSRIVAAFESRPVRNITGGPSTLTELSALVRRIAQTPPGDKSMTGPQFVDGDLSRSPVKDWWDRRTLDIAVTDSGTAAHHLYVFQDQPQQALNIVIWFDDVHVCDREGQPITFEALVEGSDEWWRTASGLRGGGDWLVEPIPLDICLYGRDG
jgi:hypothetical protein